MNEPNDESPPTPEAARPSTGGGSLRLAAAGALVLAVVAGGLWQRHQARLAAFRGEYLEACRQLRIQVRGQQFVWGFRYAGPDERFGTEDAFMERELVLPAGRRVAFQLRTKDTPHRLALHRLGIAQDAVAGETRAAWARVPEDPPWAQAMRRPGGAHAAALCVHPACWPGMRNPVRVVSPEAFEAWLQELYQQDEVELWTYGEDEVDGEYVNWGWPWGELGQPQHAQEEFPPGEAPPLPDPLPPFPQLPRE